jgi:hypothetical protein
MVCRSKWLTGSVATAALLAGAAHAHHSTTMYDRAAAVTLEEAEVKEFRWVNPHCYLTVVDRSGDGEGRTWAIEMSSPGVLTRSGWSKRTFNPGDKIQVRFGPLRNGDAGGIYLSATLADGQVMTYSLDGPQ